MSNYSHGSTVSEIRSANRLQEHWFEARPERVVRPTQHALKAVDRTLNGLRRKVITMGQLAIDQVDWITRALLEGDLQLLEEAESRATWLRELYRRIDQEIFSFIALYQPVATDLRLVRGLLRVAADLANLGAEVETMARLTPQFFGTGAQAPMLAVTRHLEQMAQLVGALLRHSVQALDGSGRDLVRKVVERQDEVRSAFERAVRSLLTHSFQDESQRRATADTLFALNGLERIADYARRIGAESLTVLDQ